MFENVVGTQGAGSRRGDIGDVNVLPGCQSPFLDSGKPHVYFPESESEHLNSSMWVLNSFANDGVNHSEALLELRMNYTQKATFKTLVHTMYFWVTLMDIPENKELAEQATTMLVQMPTSYLCEQGFSALVRNRDPRAMMNRKCQKN
ncbi:SCAN domain-containing protein 3-like 2 [Homarus americanus]|uniref:SCAN domain-containing protein 3-like 2 n=1 Tax=Homarus americanus TaxID=6706 RepID=A0A8J5JXL6_HOMAM|nr:SCAN domain-containing protein 3-like 2 [Homarus americanus]